MPRFTLSRPISPRLALAVIFGLRGFMLGNWIARIPAIADHLGVSRTELGSVLIAGAIGALVSFQVAAPRISRIGTARAIRFFGVAWVLAYPLAVFSPNPIAFFGALLLFGFVNGVSDVSLNAQAVEIEKRISTSILSTMHGMFSVGALGGGLVGGALAALGVGIGPQFLTIALGITAAWLLMSTRLVADEPSTVTTPARRRALFSFGPRQLWPLAAIAFCVGMVEEAFADWGALYLSQDLRTNPGTAALGYTVFSCAMLVGRLGGDRLVTHIGPVRVIRLGAAIGASGILSGMLINTPWAFLMVFGLTGLGFSTVIPIVYRAAGSAPGVDRATGVAGVATACYSAFLIGPPVMGFISDQFSLRVAFTMVGVLVISVIWLARAVGSLHPVTTLAPDVAAGSDSLQTVAA